jgi:hypothetical protein
VSFTRITVLIKNGNRRRRKASNGKDPKFYELTSVDVPHMVNANDEDHWRARRVFSNAFSDKALKLQEPLLSKYVDLMVQKLDEKVAADPKGKVNLVEMFNFTTFDIMGMHSPKLLEIRCLFGIGDLTFGEPLGLLQNSKYTPWVAMVFTSLKAMNALQVISNIPIVSSLVNLAIGGFVKYKRKMHFKYSADRVDLRLARKPDRPDIMTLALPQEEEKRLTLGEMHSNAALFMVAGTETTATLLSGLVYHLLMQPEKMKKLVAEIRGSFRSPQDVNMANLTRLKYLGACIEEALRLYPPVPVGLPRLTPPGGTIICGEMVPQNVRIDGCNLITSNNLSDSGLRHSIRCTSLGREFF